MALGIIGAFNEVRATGQVPLERAPKEPGLPARGIQARDVLEPIGVIGRAEGPLPTFLPAGGRSPHLGPERFRPAVGVIAPKASLPSSHLEIRLGEQLRIADVVSVELDPLYAPLEYFDVSAVVSISLADMFWEGETASPLELSSARQLEARGGGGRTPFVSLIRILIESDQISKARAMVNALPQEAIRESQLRALRRVLAPPKVATAKTTDVDRGPEYQWLKDHEREFQGQWVAVDGGQLLLAASSLKKLLEGLRGLKLTRPPLIHHFT